MIMRIALLISLLVFSVSNGMVFAESVDLPVLGKASDFELIDQKNIKTSLYDFDKKIRVVSFFFTSCPHVCPTIQQHIKTIHEKYGDKIALLSVSIDPERDSVGKLLQYQDKLGASYDSWRFLRGEGSLVESILKDAFKLGSGDLPDEHTTRVVLLDKDHNIRGYYRGLELESMEKLGIDIGSLIN